MRIESASRRVYDSKLGNWVSLKTLYVLRLCPVDVFFTARSHGLHGSTLKALAKMGYLNIEPTKDGLGFEYYLNNQGHRLRRWSITVAEAIEIPVASQLQ